MYVSMYVYIYIYMYIRICVYTWGSTSISSPRGRSRRRPPRNTISSFPGFVDCTTKAKMSQEIFPSVLTLGRGKGAFKCTFLRKIMSQHLKKLAPTHGILDSTIDGMYDHPQGEVARQVYDKQGKNSFSDLLSDALGEFW